LSLSEKLLSLLILASAGVVGAEERGKRSEAGRTQAIAAFAENPPDQTTGGLN